MECAVDPHELIGPETVSDWFSYCREVCRLTVERESAGHRIGGPGKTVEIDESKFGKRKLNKGRRVDGKWVLGGMCRETREVFLEVLEKDPQTGKERSADQLSPLIEMHVAPGTTIITDCWKGYSRVKQLYTHKSVNHSKEFVDPDDAECHTQLIENTW